MKKITRIGPGSLAKMFGFTYGLLGLIAGFVFLLISLFAMAVSHRAGWFGIAAVIILPLMYGVMGWVMGYLMAIIYNFVAKKTGGVVFDVE